MSPRPRLSGAPGGALLALLLGSLGLTQTAAGQGGGDLEGDRLALGRKLELARERLPGLVDPSLEDRLQLPAALGCATPCVSGTLSASNPYYDVFLSCSDGSFTARTGARHPVTIGSGARQNVIFGGAGGGPGTSDVSFYIHDTDTHYINPGGGAACNFDPPDTAAEPNSQGLEQEWNVSPLAGVDLVLRQELVAFGSMEADSGVRMTLAITNQPGSVQAVTVGLRWQIDYQNAGDDGPLFATVTCDPPGVDPDYWGEHDFAPAEVKDFYRIRNNSSAPIFSNVSSTTAISGIPNTSTPDRLLFGYWPSVVNSAWRYVANEGDGFVDLDSAVLYYFGYLAADGFLLEPGQSVARTVVIFTSAENVDCGGFTPGCAPTIDAPPTDSTICFGDPGVLDATGLGLADCDGSVDYEWRDASGVVATVPSTTVWPTADTDYTVTVTCSADPSCNHEETITVTVERPPELDTGGAVDVDACNAGLELSWDPATFFGPSGAGVYNVFRSETSCADALLWWPVAQGLTEPRFFDSWAPPDVPLHYLVEAEDDRAGTACPLLGVDHGGPAAHLCLPPVTDLTDAPAPAGLGIVLFARHDADEAELYWDGARPLLSGEHFHLLKAHDEAKAAFARTNSEDDRSLAHRETDRSSELQFFDLRVANGCEEISPPEFGSGLDR